MLTADADEGDALWIAKVNAILRYHYGGEPERLSNRKWVKLFNEYNYVQELERNHLERTMKTALTEVLVKLFEGVGK